MNTGGSFLRKSAAIVGAAVVVTVLALSGCITQTLFETKEHYSETVSSILITQDRTKLVFIGNDYDYIFAAPDMLIRTFESAFYPSVVATLNDFWVDKAGDIKGEYTLIISVKAPAIDKQAAASLGYRCGTIVDEGEYCEYHGTLQGTRYAASNVPVGATHKLNQTYHVGVSAEKALGPQVLLSPITVAVDGVLMLGAVPLLAAYTGAFLAICNKEHSCQ